MDETTRSAFERLLDIAGGDNGQAGRVADFVLAWWNADNLGGFDLFDLFSLDAAIAKDMATVFVTLSRSDTPFYPDDAYRPRIDAIIRMWRPDVWKRAHATA